MDTPTNNQATALRTAIDALTRRFKIAEIEASGTKPLNQIDIQVMFYVSQNPGCGPTDVARYLSVAPTTISSATDRLTRRKFLKRERPEENRRSISLSLTDDGKTFVNTLTNAQIDHCRYMLARLSPDEQTDFVKLFSKIANYES